MEKFRVKLALRISVGGDGLEQGPVGLSCIEKRPDPVVPEAGEAEGRSLDPLDEVVGRLGRSVAHLSGVPSRDLVLPALERAAK